MVVGGKKKEKQPSLHQWKSTIHKLQAILNAVKLELSVRTHL